MIPEEIISELSRDNEIETSPESLRKYETGNPLAGHHRSPQFAIRPKDVSGLQRVIRTARTGKFGLVPVSSTGPHAKGGTACAAEHAVVDLSGWKKIPWVDRRNRVCIVEPGVTYGDLNEFLRGHGMTLPTTLAPRSGKSVLAAVTDREPHIWPRLQWDMQDPVASTEFIYGTGELFRSGAAGGPGTLEEQRRSKGAQKMPMGPGQSDFQRVVIGSQGAMGVMTWISLRTELLPSVERPMIVAGDRLSKIAGYVYDAQRPWLGEQTFVLNRTAAALLMARGNAAAFDRVRGSLPEYVCLQNIAGFERLPRERLQYHYEELKEMAGDNGLAWKDSAGEVDAAALLEAARRPCGPSDWRHAIAGRCLSVFFLTQLDKSESFVGIAHESADACGILRERIGIYIQPIVQNQACHLEFMVPYDPVSSEHVEAMKRFEVHLTDRLMAAKAFFSRPYGRAAEIVYGNNPENTGLIRLIKSMFDPDNVLNPGKLPL